MRAARKARVASQRLALREGKARARVVAAAWRERVKWAKAVLRREREEGGVAGVVEPGQEARMVWPVPRPPSPGEAEREAEESVRDAVRLALARAERKRARDREIAEIGAEGGGASGGPGASARGRWAVKRARWAAKRHGQEMGGVDKRPRWLTCVERQVRDVVVEGLPTPEVLAGVRRQELARAYKRKGVKFVIHSDNARRMLALLRLQQRRRARERDRGRIRLRLFD